MQNLVLDSTDIHRDNRISFCGEGSPVPVNLDESKTTKLNKISMSFDSENEEAKESSQSKLNLF